MPTTGPVQGVGHALDPAVQPSPATPDDRPALPANDRLDEGLIAGFLLGYHHRTRTAYLADLRDFCTWFTDVGIGLSEARRIHVEGYVRQLEQAGRSRPPWPGGWPPWPASTATPSRRMRSPTPPRPRSSSPGGA
jgi:hypothetical protein